MISSVDMEASWSSSASSTAIAAGAGADDDIARLIARNGGVRAGGGFVAAALDLLWKKMRSGGLDFCWKKMEADGRWPMAEALKQTVRDLMGWPGRLAGWRSEWALAPDLSWPKKEATAAQTNTEAGQVEESSKKSRTDQEPGGELTLEASICSRRVADSIYLSSSFLPSSLSQYLKVVSRTF